MRNFYIFAFIFLPFSIFAQTINDCVDAEVVCNNGNITFNPQGAGIDDFANPNNNSGCLATGEHSSAWYYFEINATAPPNQTLGFTINPNGGAGQDYDFALFGPDVICSNLGSPIRCSYAGPGCAFCPQTGLGMGTNDQTEGAGGDGFVSEIIVQPGEGYFLLVDNFANNGTGFDLSWTGEAADDLECNADPPCALVADAGAGVTGCSGGTGFSLNGTAIGNSGNEIYSWVGTNGSTAFLDDPTSPNPNLNFPPNVSGTFDFTLTITDDACFDDDVVTITINPLPVVSLTQPDPICDDGNTYTITANPSGGIWSSNMPNGIVDPSALGAGTYQVDYTFTDANGCTNMDMTTVVINPSPTVNIDFFNTQLCTNDLPVFLTATPAGGSWSSNVPNGTLIPGNVGVGSWTITYTYIDANGCEGTDQVDINVFPEPTAIITDPGPLCDSGDPIFLNADPSGGTWSSNATGGVFIPNNFTPGFYPVTYTYTAVFGCVTTTTINIEVVSAPIADILAPPVLCTSSAPYTLTADPIGGTWGSNTPGGVVDPNVLGAGQFTAIYSYFDPTGCLVVASETVTIEEPPAVTLNIVPDLCINANPYTLVGTPVGGTWSTNSPGGIFDPLIGIGSYIVTYTYTDPASGCSEMANTSINVVNQPTVTIIGDNAFCTGTTTTLNVDTSFTNYNWSSGGNTSSIIVNMPGTYTVTVTDGSGCTTTAEQTVIENSLLNPTITGGIAICDGDTTTLDAGIFDQYNWSNGTTDQTILVSTAGTYTVTVTDLNSCTGIAETTVSSFVIPSPNISGNTTFCPGGGTVLDAGVYDQYSWSNATSMQSIMATIAGTYTITVTDGNGCTGTAEEIVSENIVTTPTISGGLTICQGDNTLLDVGNTYASYAWSNGSNSSSTTISTGGIVGVTVTDGNGCTTEASVMVVVNTLPSPTITGSTLICTGTSTDLDAGAGYTSYTWSNGETNSIFTTNQAGTYTVTVTDGNGCSGTDQVEVNYTQNLEPIITGNLSVCDGVSTTLDAGGIYTDYIWSNGETTNTISTNQVGTYTVTVTDDSGCTGTNQVAVSLAPGLSPIITGDPNFCNNTSTDINAGVFNSYIWSDGSTNQILNVTASGTYTVTVSDVVGCTGIDEMIITEYPIPVPQISGSTSFCTGSSTTLDAGIWINYSWSVGSTASSINVMAPGVYTVTITDGNGCTGITSVDIIESTSLNPTIVGNLSYCPDGSTTLDAGFGFETYVWSDGSINQTIDVITSGDFTVTVSDVTGCSGTSVVSVAESIPPNANIVGQNSFCAGTNTTLDAEGGFLNYMWSDGSSNQTLTVNQTGTYAVTVTDANGCTDETFLDVEELQTLEPMLSGINSFCEGSETTISAISGFSTYFWSDNSTDEFLLINSPGTYTVTVTDANNCTGSESFIMTQNDNPIINITGDTQFCPGSSNICLAPPGYVNYLWSDGSIAENLQVNNAGTYTVTVTDSNGCTGTDETTVNELSPPTTIITGIPNFCSGESTILDAGAGFTSYVWSDGSTNQNLIANQAGTFTVTITDINGCTGLTSIVVSENIPVNAGTANPTTNFCSIDATLIHLQNEIIGADANGTWTEISVIPSLGTGFDSTVGAFNTGGQNPGTYSFEYLVVGSGSCPNDTETVTIVVDQTPIALIGQPTALDCNNPTTFLDATNSIGGTDLSFQWSVDGNLIPSSNSAMLMIDSGGNYDLLVSLPNGCSATTFIEIVENFEAPDADSGMNQQLTCQNGQVTLNGSSSIPGAIYTWEGPGITSVNLNDQNPLVTSAGDYSLIVTNPQNGCESSSTMVMVIADINSPAFTLEEVAPLDCNNSTQVLTGPFADNFAYQWFLNGDPIPGATNQEYEADVPGNYSLEITDINNGCDAIEIVSVNESIDPPIAEAGTADMITCIIGSVSLEGTGSTVGDITYQWIDFNGDPIPNSNTLNISVSQPGTYTLIVTNNENGCFATDEVTVELDNNPPTADAGTDASLDCDLTPIQIGGNSSIGSNFIYNWTTQNGGTIINPTSANPSINQPGTYQIEVTNTDNGCTLLDTILVSENPNFPVQINYELMPISCDGEDDGSITILNVDGGTQPYQYSFNDGIFSDINTFPFLGEGNYSLLVTDALGCELETEVNLVAPAPFILDLGADITIELGETAQINTTASQPYDSLWWSFDATLPCNNCPNPIIAPIETTAYQANALNFNGCEDTDDITIFVEKNRNIFIPNVFTPNDDGNNDVFIIHGGIDVEKIHVLKIFNRWGEQIFEQTNIQPNDYSVGWDGFFKGEKMNPAVFVYFAEIEFRDGFKIIYRGDVALRK